MSDMLLVDGNYSARRFVELVDELYPTVPPEPSDIRVNRQALEDCVALNWLLLPEERSQEDDDHTKDWRSRDIPPQVTVYADYQTIALDEDGISRFRTGPDGASSNCVTAFNATFTSSSGPRNRLPGEGYVRHRDNDRREDKEEPGLSSRSSTTRKRALLPRRGVNLLWTACKTFAWAARKSITLCCARASCGGSATAWSRSTRAGRRAAGAVGQENVALGHAAARRELPGQA
jgi:hypothetical protein